MPRQDPDQRLGLHIGYVTNREDPDNLGRVKICVPGLLEPESAKWCWPLAVGGGYAQWGTFDPPPVNATVGVLFNQGNIDEPYFLTGPWGSPDEQPDTPEGSTIHSDDTQIVVTEDKQWKISRDSHDLEQHYELIHKDQEIAIKIDNVPGTGQSIHIRLDHLDLLSKLMIHQQTRRLKCLLELVQQSMFRALTLKLGSILVLDQALC